MIASSSKRCLYVCSTQLSLLSALVLQMTVNAGRAADLFLLDASDWSTVLDNVRHAGLFDNVDIICIREETRLIKQLPTPKDRHDACMELTRRFKLPRFSRYQDMYVYLDSLDPKLIYYTLVQHGIVPDVSFMEEATASYTYSYQQSPNDFLDHLQFGENNFYQHLKRQYLYQPELYLGGDQVMERLPLTKINDLTSEQQQILRQIYPSTPQIQEKVIFFEGCFHADGLICDEYELLMKIIDRVGKENVIVKRHPRVKVDRYTDKGIKVLANSNVPWEVMLMSQSLQGKLLVSVASFTCMSPLTIYGMEYRAMLLNNLRQGVIPFLSEPSYVQFITNVEAQLNRKRQNIWNPMTLKEMYLQLDSYLAEGKDAKHA